MDGRVGNQESVTIVWEGAEGLGEDGSGGNERNGVKVYSEAELSLNK